MQISEAAEVIRETVPMESILNLYGYSTNRSGFMHCPFHSGDRTPSLKVFREGKKGWYCFGCHAGGSVIDFVMLHESCSFPMAVRAIDRALSLDLLTVETWDEQEAFRSLQRWLDEAEAAMLVAAEVERGLLVIRYEAAFERWWALDSIPRAERSAVQCTQLENEREELAWLDELFRRLDEFREEVRAWRTRHRVREKKRRRRSS